MKRILELMANLFLKKDFILFVAIGGVNTLTAIAISYLISGWLDPNLSYVTGYVFGFLVSYFLNSRFTFCEPPAWDKLIKYAIATIPNFLIQNGIVILCYNILGWHKLVAYVLAAAVGVPVTFLLQKFFTFHKGK